VNVDEDADKFGYLELFAHLGSPAGHGDDRDDAGLPQYHFTFGWLTPQRLLAIATDLNAAEERGDDVVDTLQAWREAELAGLLPHDGEADT
jgi:hypothetical protein